MSSYLPWLDTAIGDYYSGLTLKAMLLDDTYVYDAADEFRADLAGEVTGTGYTAGGIAVTGLAVAVDVTAGLVKVDFDDVDFGTIDVGDFAAVAVYVDTGSSATDTLIGIDQFGATPTDGSEGTVYVVGDNGFISLDVF